MVGMVAVVQINIIVSDLERSREFYQRLGLEFTRRSRFDVETVEAWVSTNTGVTVVLHSPPFAAWWDESTPGPTSAGPQIDLELESAESLEAIVEDTRSAGGVIAKEPTDMSWGRRFAILIDPDGYRIGLKSPLARPTQRPAG